MTAIERQRRHEVSVEKAFERVSPKPEVVYNVRMKRTVPIFERQYRELEQFIGRGANPSEVLAGVEKMLSDLEEKYLYAGEAPALHTLDAVHDEEYRVECEANPIQLRARVTRRLEDLRAALDATDDEISTLKRFRRGVRRLLDQKVLLEAQAS
jgi:hypothetical protein